MLFSCSEYINDVSTFKNGSIGGWWVRYPTEQPVQLAMVAVDQQTDEALHKSSKPIRTTLIPIHCNTVVSRTSCPVS